MTDTPLSMSIQRFAEYSGISATQIRQWANLPEGERIPGFYMGEGRRANGRRSKFMVWVNPALTWINERGNHV